MDGEFTIPDDTRVRLLGHIDGSFYNGMAKTGNEGWITKHRVDSHGLPEAYIKWDRDHWADNQQPDRWTYEEHFEPIPDVQQKKETRMSADNMDKERLWEFFQAFMFEDAEGTAGVPDLTQDEDDIDQAMWLHYDEQAARAADILDNAEAFFIIGVQRGEGGPDAPQGQLIVSMAGSSVTPETDALVGSQMAEVAARYHKNAAYTIIQHLTESDVSD